MPLELEKSKDDVLENNNDKDDHEDERKGLKQSLRMKSFEEGAKALMPVENKQEQRMQEQQPQQRPLIERTVGPMKNFSDAISVWRLQLENRPLKDVAKNPMLPYEEAKAIPDSKLFARAYGLLKAIEVALKDLAQRGTIKMSKSQKKATHKFKRLHKSVNRRHHMLESYTNSVHGYEDAKEDMNPFGVVGHGLAKGGKYLVNSITKLGDKARFGSFKELEGRMQTAGDDFVRERGDYLQQAEQEAGPIVAPVGDAWKSLFEKAASYPELKMTLPKKDEIAILKTTLTGMLLDKKMEIEASLYR